MTLAILETAIYATDLDSAEAFYGGLIGLEKIIRAGDRHVFFWLEGSVLLIFNPEKTESQPAGLSLPIPGHGSRGPGHLCFKATRAEQAEWQTKLESAGYPLESKVDWPNGAQSVYFRDPASNSIEFAEPDLWTR